MILTLKSNNLIPLCFVSLQKGFIVVVFALFLSSLITHSVTLSNPPGSKNESYAT